MHFVDVITHTTNSAKTYTPCWGRPKGSNSTTNSILTEVEYYSISIRACHIYTIYFQHNCSYE